MHKIIFETESEWLKVRKEHIGASDAGIIMGVSRWKTNDGRIKTPYLLWQEKLGLDEMDCDNPATRYGKAMEAPAREAYQEMVGDLFEPVCVKNAKYPHLMVSLDGLNVTDDRAVEIKNCKSEDHELARAGKVPPKYYAQVQMQAMVTELHFVDYFSFHKNEGILVKVARDEVYIKKMEKKLDAFWKCVETLKEPALTDDDFVEQGNEWLKIAEKLYDLKLQKKAIADQEKDLGEMLKESSSHRNACSGLYRYTRSTTIGRVDYKAIPALANVNLDDFRGNTVTSWRIHKNKS